MGNISEPQPVLLILAAFSRHESAFRWAKEQAEGAWGRVALESKPVTFDATGYYEPTMGRDIQKCFWAFERFVDPGVLAERKWQTNDWEALYAKHGEHAEQRPLNLDPGYLTPAKLVLASTKDHAHRIYLSRGIFAEVTLYFKERRWQHREWTFADYRRSDYQRFFTECRDYLRRGLREDRRE